MDEKRNEEMSVDELLEKLKASLASDGDEKATSEKIDEDDDIKRVVAAAIGVEETVEKAEEAVEEAVVEEAVEAVEETTEEITEETAEEPVAAAQINEEDILAAWGIDREEMQKTQTVDMSAVKEEYAAPVAVSTSIYRIARVESKAEHTQRKQTEAQKKSVDYDKVDYSLIKQALGMEKPSDDTDNFPIFDVEEPTAAKTIDGPHAEFTYQRQREDITADYSKLGRSSLIKLIATVLTAVLLFAVEGLPAFGAHMPAFLDVARYPVVFSMVTLQLMWLCSAVSYKEIANGFLSILSAKFTSGSMLCIMVLVATICGVINCTLGSAGQTYHFSAVFMALLIRVFDYLDVRRETFSFEVASSAQSKKYVAATVPSDEAADIEGLEDYTGEDALVLRTEKCTFVENYFARTERRSERDIAMNKYLLPVLAATALISLIAVFATGKGAANAFGAFNLAFAVGVPVLTILSASYPLYKAAKKLYRKESAIIGETSVEEYAGTTMICFDDADAFPSYGVALENLRIYGSADIETIIEQMGAVFSKLGGPLKSVFALMTSDCPRPYKVKIDGMFENGIKATVDGRPLHVGSVEFMRDNGFKVLDSSNEIGGKHFSTMFLAENGELRAKFYIRYTLDGGFESIIKKLARRGISSVILTGDSNINDELLAQSIDISRLPVKVVRRRDFDGIPVSDRADSGVVSRRGVGDLVGAITMCDRLASVIGTMRAVRVASVVICALLTVGAASLAMSATVASAYVFIYHLFWMIPAWLVSKIKL